MDSKNQNQRGQIMPAAGGENVMQPIQRHKCAGALHLIVDPTVQGPTVPQGPNGLDPNVLQQATGGGAAKRTAFADLSNTSRALIDARQMEPAPGIKGKENVKIQPGIVARAELPAPMLDVVTCGAAAEEAEDIADAADIAAALDAADAATGASEIKTGKLGLVIIKGNVTRKTTTAVYRDAGPIQELQKRIIRDVLGPIVAASAQSSSGAAAAEPRHYKSQPALHGEPSGSAATVMRDGAADHSAGILPDLAYGHRVSEHAVNGPSFPRDQQFADHAADLSDNSENWYYENMDSAALAAELGIADVSLIRAGHGLRRAGAGAGRHSSHQVMPPRIGGRDATELELAATFVARTQPKTDREDELWDITVVAEYGPDIFKYMRQLEAAMVPNPNYMKIQNEIEWSMRAVLVDWIVQVHARFSLMPETLFLAVNYIDRFLAAKVVSVGKLQLVGATAILVAAKYEEINCPALTEIEYMVDGGYSSAEIIKAERYMLTMLNFELGWPGPMSFLRRISRADNYNLVIRTTAKYLLEVAIIDHRFVGCVASQTAAAAHCLAGMVLGHAAWTPAHVHYSGYTYDQIVPAVRALLESARRHNQHYSAVYDKYCDRRYNRCAEVFAQRAVNFELPATQPSVTEFAYHAGYFSESDDQFDDDDGDAATVDPACYLGDEDGLEN